MSNYKVHIFLLTVFLFACTAVPQPSALTQASPPYSASAVITAVTFDWNTHIQQASGSDNWPITWADDNHQYTSWGDGKGFNQSSKKSLGVARITGDQNNYIGNDTWTGNGKSYGIISIDGNLYMWVSPGSDSTNYDEAKLQKSTNYGQTWTPATWVFTKADGIVLPTILQYGQDYADGGNYVYSYFIRLQDSSALKVQKPGQIDLVRVHKNNIMTRSAYQFFAGLNGSNEPTWDSNIANKQPVFEDPNGVGWNLSVSHNAGLNRYLLMTEHSQSFKGNLGIFDAPNPWGPWTTVAYYSNWQSTQSTFFWNFSNKWLSADGKSFTIVFTGIGSYDSWNTVQGTFTTTPLDPQAYLPLVTAN